MTLVSIVLFSCALGTSVNSNEMESLHHRQRGVLMDNVFYGSSLSLIRRDVCWDGIGQSGTWHETDVGYLWILVGMDLNPCGFCDGVAD